MFIIYYFIMICPYNINQSILVYLNLELPPLHISVDLLETVQNNIISFSGLESMK